VRVRRGQNTSLAENAVLKKKAKVEKMFKKKEVLLKLKITKRLGGSGFMTLKQVLSGTLTVS
jgi:hypothetical protein